MYRPHRHVTTAQSSKKREFVIIESKHCLIRNPAAENSERCVERRHRNAFVFVLPFFVFNF